MIFLQKILDNVGRSWNKIAGEIPAIAISSGSGTHTMITLDDTSLYFHSVSFRSDLPVKQTVTLAGLTLNTLAQLLASMGYGANVAPGAGNLGATCLIPVENCSIPVALTAFTSPIWQMLYPLHRLLAQVDSDTDEAIRQMYLTSSRGSWVDYWSSFFNIRRAIGELDDDLIKRIYVKIFRTKTNNIAIQEALKFHTNTDAQVNDYAPAQFQVISDPDKFMNNVDLMHTIIMEVKGAGIDYFIDFMKSYSEDYKKFVADREGVTFTKSDISLILPTLFYSEVQKKPVDSLLSMAITQTFYEFYEMGQGSFRLNVNDLNSFIILNNQVDPDLWRASMQAAFTDVMAKPVDKITSFGIAMSDSYNAPPSAGYYSFEVNVSTLNSVARLSSEDKKIFDSPIMIMTQSGTVVRKS